MKACVLALTTLALAGLFSTDVSDWDFWFHLTSGRYTWQTHSLTTPDPFAFTTALIATGASGTLTVNSFQFSTNSPCFVSGETESGTFTLSGNFSGKVSGSFGMNVRSGSPAGNTLTLMGTVSGNTISGTWTLSGGSGCSGNGNFTMTRM